MMHVLSRQAAAAAAPDILNDLRPKTGTLTLEQVVNTASGILSQCEKTLMDNGVNIVSRKNADAFGLEEAIEPPNEAREKPEDSVKTSLEVTKPKDPQDVFGASAAVTFATHLSKQAKEVIFDSMKKARTERLTQSSENEGVMETETSVVIMDCVYIAIAFTMPILTVAALHERSTSFAPESNRTIIYVCDVFLQLFTLLWVAMQFFVQRKNGEWEMVILKENIKQHYLRKRFVIDCLYAIPIEWIFMGWNFTIFTWLSIRHAIRLVRMFDLTWSSNPLLGRRNGIQFCAILAMASFVACSLAAIFWALEDAKDFVDSMYWMGMTVTTIGYGDVVASSNQSRIFSIFVMLYGMVSVATLSGWAAKLMTQSDRVTAKMDDDKELLDSMLEYYQVPWPLRRELITLFPTVLELQQSEDFKNLMDSLPSVVTAKIEIYSTAKFLRNLSIFEDLKDPEAMMQLSQKMAHQYIPSKDVVIAGGSVGDQIFFIMRGIAERTVYKFLNSAGDEVSASSTQICNCSETTYGELHAGDNFGSEAILKKPAPFSIESRVVLELSVLKVDDLESLAAKFPPIQQIKERLINGITSDSIQS